MDPSGTSRSTERLGQEPAGRGFCRSARLPWDVGKNAASNQSDAAPRLPLFRCGRDWPPRRYGGPERIRGVMQQVERGSYLLSAFFPSLYLSHFLTLFLFLSRSNTRSNDGCEVWVRLFARIIAAVAAAVAFLTYPPSVGGQPDASGPLIPPKTIADGSGGGGEISGGVKTAHTTERDMIVMIAEATTNAARRGRGWQKPRGMGSAGSSSRGGDGGVEKLADYSIVELVVSVNRNAPWTFVVLLRACSLHSD